MAKPQSAQIEIDDAGQTLFGYSYVYLLIKRARLRKLFEKYTASFLLISLFLLLVELVLEGMGLDLARGTIVLRTLFAVAFTVAVFGKYREWTESRDDFLFVGSARAIAAVLGRHPDHSSYQTSIPDLLKIFHGNFKLKKNALNVTLALRDEDRGTLSIGHRYPEQESRPTRFNIGEGGAGYAYQNKCLVYIPWKELGHAVIQKIDDEKEHFSMITLLYRQTSKEKPYRAILCAPLVVFGTCYGSLNFDCDRRNAFKGNDLVKAYYFAAAVAQVLHNQALASSMGGPGTTKSSRSGPLRLTRR